MSFKQKKPQRYIFKLHSKRLKADSWCTALSLDEALDNLELVSISDSTVLRWIDELNGTGDIDKEWRELTSQIKAYRKEKSTPESRFAVKKLYSERNRLQFVSDYICIVMDSVKDYRALYKHGCEVNGKRFKRLLTTTGGVKSGTVVFVADSLWCELRRRLDNGRDLNKKIVPAKFGAYEALACSSSVPVSPPKGILVVPDCYTDFKEDVITIDDRGEGEPLLSHSVGYDIHKNCSDGFGTMTPERAKIWSEELGLDYIMSGCNTRYAFEKGMLVTFDHVAFAEQVNHASAGNPQGYIVKDVWGHDVDVRNVDVVFTESMLKLWDSYCSIDEYLANCNANHYSIAITKVTPKELDNEWTTNYQFLQSYKLTDDDIFELAKPTIDMISDVLGGDYRKLMIYANGKKIDDNSFLLGENTCLKALMADKRECNDPYVVKIIHNMIENRIRQAKLGKLNVHGHFCIACGDPYSLWQSIFSLKVTGLLNAREIYSKFWVDQKADEVVCFRAPMTCHNNIRKMSVRQNTEVDYWYKYITTMIVFNSWDSSMDAMNGEDYDGDQNFVTDNPVLLRNTRDVPTIFCIQRKADKHHILSDELIVESNINSFGNKIGKITNDITAQFDLLTQHKQNTLEFNTLEYRIMTGQLYQQNEIDKAKGIVTKPRPPYWFNYRDNKILEKDNYATRHHKNFNQLVAVEKKPYFMIYNYESQRKEYINYKKKTEGNCMMRFGVGVEKMINKPNRTQDEEQFVKYYQKLMPITSGDHVINRLSYIFEDIFDGCLKKINANNNAVYNYSILLGLHPVDTNSKTAKDLKKIYELYLRNLKSTILDLNNLEACDKDIDAERKNILSLMTARFVEQCDITCPDKIEQTSYLVHLLYRTNVSKRFVWEICGEQIINNLLEANNYIIEYPIQTKDGEFTYAGKQYSMVKSDLSWMYLGVNNEK